MKALSESSAQADVCGALGCRERPEAVVRHPDYGHRTLCSACAQELLRKPPQGRESERRPASGSERAEAAEPTPPESRDRPEAGDPERSPEPEARPLEAPPGRGRLREAVRSRRWSQ